MGNRRKRKIAGSRMNFFITVLTMSAIFIFVGYLMGNYATDLIKEEHKASMEMERAKPRNVEVIETSAPVSSISREVQTNPSQDRSPAPPNLPGPVQVPSIKTDAEISVFYRVQVGAFSEKVNADNLAKRLKDDGYECLVTPGPPYRVQTGAFSSEGNAKNLMDELKSKGFEAIIVR
ncbi:MAG: SPOR domain-containing protein [Bacillota bacterium]|nr:SPOR domain-containing protein [Bacillota bacterium]HHU60713.1 SPOR domain-containing protein [Natronincola sp.]